MTSPTPSFPIWHPPPGTKPSRSYMGEPRKAIIFEAVGETLHLWESLEMTMATLFRRLCEAESLAAQRAYGTLFGANAKGDAIEAAADEFFRRRRAPTPADAERMAAARSWLTRFVSAHGAASTYRNNIAHGMAWEMHTFVQKEDGTQLESLGFYLCAAPQTTRKLELPDSHLSKYYYRVAEIKHCGGRFAALQHQALDLLKRLNDDYPER
jgi:hypothetical protein